MKRLLERLVEVGVGLLALVVAGFGAWCCYYVLVHPTEGQAQGVVLWAILALLGLLTAGSALYGARLVWPPLRPADGQIIGQQGRLVFLVLYVTMAGVAIGLGTVRTRHLAFPVVLIMALAAEWRRSARRQGQDQAPAA